MNDISNIQNEILFVGSFYKKPDLYVEYGRFIRAEFDLVDEIAKFFYNCFELYYKTTSDTIDEMKLNTFMSQDPERFKTYKKYGGYKTISVWMNMADTKDFQNYINVVKKYSLLREYNRKGYDVSKIMNHKAFETMKPNDIYRIIRSTVDKISTVIMANEDSVVVTNDNEKALNRWLLKPQMGAKTPFDLINEMFRGLRGGKLVCLGFLSNQGKTRLAIYLAAYLAFIEDKKVCMMCNETDEDDFRACLLTTVINNDCFKDLHGIDIDKQEREIVLGQYVGDNGYVVERYVDEHGIYTESEDDFIDRLYNTSKQYRDVLAIAQWMEEQTENKIFYKFMKSYSDEDIEFEIRKHNIAHGVEHFIYDTLKGYKSDEWTSLKQTVTMLSSLMIELNTNVWSDIQLTDDTINTDVFSLSSNNLANSKQ